MTNFTIPNRPPLKKKKLKIDFRMEYEHLPGDVYINQKRWQPEERCLTGTRENRQEKNSLSEVQE